MSLTVDTGGGNLTSELENDEALTPEFLAALHDEDFGASHDMDSPGISSSQPSKRKFGGLKKSRFRRRSMQDHCADDGSVDMEQLTLMNEWWDSVAGGFGVDSLTREQLTSIVTANYTPSQVEIEAVVKWLDVNQDGSLSFDEYCLGMARVLERAGLTANDGLEAAQAAMSDDLALLLSFDEEQAAQQTAPEVPAFKRAPSKAEIFNDKIIEEVRERLGPDLVEYLRINFDAADPEGTGGLTSEQVEALVKATYVPRGQHLGRFMKWFTHALGPSETDEISKEDYLDCMLKLQLDLNYLLVPCPPPSTVELLKSPKSRRGAPGAPSPVRID